MLFTSTTWMHPDVHLRPAPLLFSNGNLPALHAGLGEWEPHPHPCWKCPLLEGFLDGSGWDHPSRSGHQQGSVGILNQGHVIESRPICSAQAQWDCWAGLIPARPEGSKGARGQREAQTRATYRWGGPHCSLLYESPQGLGVLRNCQHGQESQPNQPHAYQPGLSLC